MRSIFVLPCFVFLLLPLPTQSAVTRIFGVKNRNVTLNCDSDINDVKHCVWTHGGDTLEYAIGTKNLTENHYWNVELDPKACGITLKNLGLHHEEGKWQCHRVNNFGVTHDPVDYFVHVIKPPILLLKFNGSSRNEFQIGRTYAVSCDVSPELKHFVSFQEMLVNYSNLGARKLKHLTKSRYFYEPVENDETLTCYVTLGNDESKYYYKEFAQLQKINFIYSPSFVNETQFKNLTTKIIYDGKVVPNEAFIKLNQNKTIPIDVYILDEEHFFILVDSNLIDKIDFRNCRLQSSRIIFFDLTKRIEDIDITLKILLPFCICVVLILSLTVVILAKRNHWWCFAPTQKPSKVKINRLMNKVNSLSSSDSSSTKNESKTDSASLASTTSYGNVHFYESVIDSKSSSNEGEEGADKTSEDTDTNNIYETLDFERPLEHLQGHYTSSKTLKSICSTDEYLCPSDSSLLKE